MSLVLRSGTRCGRWGLRQRWPGAPWTPPGLKQRRRRPHHSWLLSPPHSEKSVLACEMFGNFAFKLSKPEKLRISDWWSQGSSSLWVLCPAPRDQRVLWSEQQRNSSKKLSNVQVRLMFLCKSERLNSDTMQQSLYSVHSLTWVLSNFDEILPVAQSH